MPCTYYDTSSTSGVREQEHAKLKSELDKTTDLLCKLCTALEKEDADWAMPPDVRKWWKNHQEMDKRRQAAERYNTALRSLRGIQKTIEDIEKLGGVARPALKKALTDAQDELAAASKENDKYR